MKSSSSFVPLTMAGVGIAAVLLLVALLVSVLLAPLAIAQAAAQMSGSGGGAAGCTAPASTCPGSSGNPLAAWALAIATHLRVCGHPAQDTCYDQTMPWQVTDYWASACPRGTACWSTWQSGDVQCVQLVTAAYALSQVPLPAKGNAIDYWTLYQHRSGWQAIPVGDGLPQPGDMIVWSHVDPATGLPDAGHIAIVVSVTAPTSGHAGSVLFAEANGPAPLASEPLTASLQVITGGHGYTVMGFIRYTGPWSMPHVRGEAAFVCALLPFAWLAQIEQTEGPAALPRPWDISLLLAQWGVEQGWVLPGYTGYNLGNVAALPGYPQVPGTSTAGSPTSFAYGTTAQQGVAEEVTVSVLPIYASVSAAWSQGPLAQATALGASPWDAGQYTTDRHPGDLLVATIQRDDLTRFDQPGVACA